MAARFADLSLALAICVSLFACGGQGAKPATEAEQRAMVAEAAGSHRLRPGEKIRVTVYGETALSGEFQIDPSGYISLPLVGTVKAEGATVKEVEDNLVKGYSREYLKNPKITVTIAEFRPFYILGEVEKPGQYPYATGLSVLSAIAIAGGTTYRASTSNVLIQHAGESNLREYSLDAGLPIMPGDVIQVPRRYF